MNNKIEVLDFFVVPGVSGYGHSTPGVDFDKIAVRFKLRGKIYVNVFEQNLLEDKPEELRK